MYIVSHHWFLTCEIVETCWHGISRRNFPFMGFPSLIWIDRTYAIDEIVNGQNKVYSVSLFIEHNTLIMLITKLIIYVMWRHGNAVDCKIFI